MIRWLLGILAGVALLALVNAASSTQGWWRFLLGLVIGIAALGFIRRELAREGS